MASNKIIGLALESISGLERVMEGVSPSVAEKRVGNASSYAWTMAHVARELDAALNGRFQEAAPNPVLNVDRFRTKEGAGSENWAAIRAAVEDVLTRSRTFLLSLTGEDLNRVASATNQTGDAVLNSKALRYVLLRLAAHHYVHIGEIATLRAQAGDSIGDFPGDVAECM